MSAAPSFLANASTTPDDNHLRISAQENADAAAVNAMVAPAVRRINLNALNAFFDHVHTAHSSLPELIELKSGGQLAIGRFPVPVLGPGLPRTVASMSDAESGVRNVMRILINAESRLRRGHCINTADAMVQAFAAHHSWSLLETRKRLIQASHDCEFFSPELVLMLEALAY